MVILFLMTLVALAIVVGVAWGLYGLVRLVLQRGLPDPGRSPER